MSLGAAAATAAARVVALVCLFLSFLLRVVCGPLGCVCVFFGGACPGCDSYTEAVTVTEAEMRGCMCACVRLQHFLQQLCVRVVPALHSVVRAVLDQDTVFHFQGFGLQLGALYPALCACLGLDF